MVQNTEAMKIHSYTRKEDLDGVPNGVSLENLNKILPSEMAAIMASEGLYVVEHMELTDYQRA